MEYTTSVYLQLTGRSGPNGPKALTLSLSDAHIEECYVRYPHMTILYYENGFDTNMLEQVEQEKQKFMQILGKNTLNFTLSYWGRSSDLIHGELYDFCIHMRNRFGHYCSDNRKPHVKLRN